MGFEAGGTLSLNSGHPLASCVPSCKSLNLSVFSKAYMRGMKMPALQAGRLDAGSVNAASTGLYVAATIVLTESLGTAGSNLVLVMEPGEGIFPSRSWFLYP